MGIPKLKRINVYSEQELEVCLTKNSGQEKSIMVVTHTNATHQKFVSREQVGQILANHGSKTGSRYNIGSNLLGHVITRIVKVDPKVTPCLPGKFDPKQTYIVAQSTGKSLETTQAGSGFQSRHSSGHQRSPFFNRS
jgi:hypothetical protein